MSSPELKKPLSINDLKQCMILINGIESRWEAVGLELGVSPNDLQAIDRDKNQCEDKLREVCRYWLQGNVVNKDKQPNMDKLIKAIGAKHAGKNWALANRMKRQILEKPIPRRKHSRTRRNTAKIIPKGTHKHVVPLNEESTLLANRNASLDKESDTLDEENGILDEKNAHIDKDNDKGNDTLDKEITLLDKENSLLDKKDTLDTSLSKYATEDVPLKEGIGSQLKEELPLSEVVSSKGIAPIASSGCHTVKVIIIRKLKFDSKWLQAILPRINLSCCKRMQVVKELKLIAVDGHFIQAYDCIARGDIKIGTEAYREDIEKLQKKCPNPDLVLFCTPLLNQRLCPADQQKIRKNDSNTINFFSKVWNKKIWTNTLFVFSRVHVATQDSTTLKKKISRRCDYLKERIQDSTCATLMTPLEYCCVDNRAHEKPTWKANIISNMCRCCTKIARPVLQSCLDDRR